MPDGSPAGVESAARDIAEPLMARGGGPRGRGRVQEVDVDSRRMTRPRSAGVELRDGAVRPARGPVETEDRQGARYNMGYKLYNLLFLLSYWRRGRDSNSGRTCALS